MNKTEKRLDKKIVRALTDICENAKYDIQGFKWLTHTADYNDYPNSLRIYCVFDTQAQVQKAKESGQTIRLADAINQALRAMGVLPKDTSPKVLFDTEEAGASNRLLGE